MGISSPFGLSCSSSVVVMNNLTLLCSILITLCIRLSLFFHSYTEFHLSTNLPHIPVYKVSSSTLSLQHFFSCWSEYPLILLPYSFHLIVLTHRCACLSLTIIVYLSVPLSTLTLTLISQPNHVRLGTLWGSWDISQDADLCWRKPPSFGPHLSQSPLHHFHHTLCHLHPLCSGLLSPCPLRLGQHCQPHLGLWCCNSTVIA